MRFSLREARTAGAGARRGRRVFAPWVEVSVWVAARVSDWDFEETVFRNWAVRGGAPDTQPPRPFDPARYAVRAEEPEDDARAALPPPPDAMRSIASNVWTSWRPVVHRHRESGLVSRLDEPVAAFRRRSLRLLAPPFSPGPQDMARARAMSALAAAIETRPLGSGEVVLLRGEVGITWYPEDEGPTLASRDLMIDGDVRERI